MTYATFRYEEYQFKNRYDNYHRITLWLLHLAGTEECRCMYMDLLYLLHLAMKIYNGMPDL